MAIDYLKGQPYVQDHRSTETAQPPHRDRIQIGQLYLAGRLLLSNPEGACTWIEANLQLYHWLV